MRPAARVGRVEEVGAQCCCRPLYEGPIPWPYGVQGMLYSPRMVQGQMLHFHQVGKGSCPNDVGVAGAQAVHWNHQVVVPPAHAQPGPPAHVPHAFHASHAAHGPSDLKLHTSACSCEECCLCYSNHYIGANRTTRCAWFSRHDCHEPCPLPSQLLCLDPNVGQCNQAVMPCVKHTGGASAVFNDNDGRSTRFHMAEDFPVALGLASEDPAGTCLVIGGLQRVCKVRTSGRDCRFASSGLSRECEPSRDAGYTCRVRFG
ncbi:hypothetical protein HaLaN_21540, partial [Haematococcus lacustris]